MSNKYLKWSQVAHAKVWAGEAATAGAEAASPPQQNRENWGQPGSQGQQTSPSWGCKHAAINFCHLSAPLPKEKLVALQLSTCRCRERFHLHHLVLCQQNKHRPPCLGARWRDPTSSGEELHGLIFPATYCSSPGFCWSWESEQLQYLKCQANSSNFILVLIIILIKVGR